MFFCKKIEKNRIKYELCGIKFSYRRGKTFVDIVKSIPRFLLSPFPIKIKYYILGFLDNEYKWKWEIRYKKFSYDEIFKLFNARTFYPKNILSVENTVKYIVENNCSVARIGDGEELLNNIIGAKCIYPELALKLKKILADGTNNKCLVCINNFGADTENCPVSYRKHFTHYYMNISENLKDIKFSENVYGDAYSLLFYFINNDLSIDEQNFIKKLEYIKQIFNNKKILFVVNKDSYILNDNLLFNNSIMRKYIYIPCSNAYSDYSRILNEITSNYDNTWLIYIEGGAMATVLAYECSELGYRALDMGDFYTRIIYNNKIKIQENLDCYLKQ